MYTEQVIDNALYLSEAPPVPGVVFRRFRGESDFPAMAAVIQRCREADGIEELTTVEDLRRRFDHLVNCDPQRDMVMVEAYGELVGYLRVRWLTQQNGARIYHHWSWLLPSWRDQGIRLALLRHAERRLAGIAADHPSDGPRFLQAWAADTQEEKSALLVSQGYRPTRYFYEMVRPNLDDVPEAPMPPGLEVRPVRPEHYRSIWEANGEAFQDHWGAVYPLPEEWYQEWLDSRTFQPELWQVAWDGDEVAGMVLNFVDAEENERYNRKRGYTEDICVRRAWRRRGLATALLVRSFRLFRDRGLTKAALGVDADNPNGALRLYQSVGFRTVKEYTTYRKPLE